MFGPAAIAQAKAIEATFFAAPPHRSNRPAPRRRGGIASLVGSVRRAFSDAAGEPTPRWLPRLINYPY
jgi:hypothetical protein